MLAVVTAKKEAPMEVSMRGSDVATKKILAGLLMPLFSLKPPVHTPICINFRLQLPGLLAGRCPQ